MSKTIKLTDEVYERLYRIQAKGETFSQAVERCLFVMETVRGVADTIGASHYVNERQRLEVK